MRSSEEIDAVLTTPVSRRTMAAGLWAAPVIAVTVASPALAASLTRTLSVGSTTKSGVRTWTVSYGNMPTGTVVTVSATGNVTWTGGGSGTPATPTTNLAVTVSGTGTFTFTGDPSIEGTIAGGGVTGVAFT